MSLPGRRNEEEWLLFLADRTTKMALLTFGIERTTDTQSETDEDACCLLCIRAGLANKARI
jgi:hypothetical protein